MSDLRGALEREGERFDLQPGALERVFERRRRTRARRRWGAAVAVLIVIASTVWVVKSLGGLGTRPPIAARPASPIEGTWRTAPLNEQDVQSAFMAAGGTAEQGRAFFSQLGDGAKRSAVITLRFEGGAFVEFESSDGGPPVTGYEARYRIFEPGTLTISAVGCTGTYSFEVEGLRLSLHVIDQCGGHDGPYNTTLFASFPLTKQG